MGTYHGTSMLRLPDSPGMLEDHMGGQRMEVRILVLAASRSQGDRLVLDHEVREIEGQIRGSRYRDAMVLRSCWAVRPQDLVQALDEHRPHNVHVSAHGTRTGQILLLDDGDAMPVSQEALARVFGAMRGQVRLVVFNACYSVPHAEAVSAHVDCAVGYVRRTRARNPAKPSRSWAPFAEHLCEDRDSVRCRVYNILRGKERPDIVLNQATGTSPGPAAALLRSVLCQPRNRRRSGMRRAPRSGALQAPRASPGRDRPPGTGCDPAVPSTRPRR